MQIRIINKRKIIRNYSIIIIILLFSVSCSDSNSTSEPEINENTIVNKYGIVSVSGSKLVSEYGDQISLRGMSLFWSQWASEYYSEETIKWLIDDWKCTVIRAAMGVENGGYLENPTSEYQKITAVIDACIKFGIYIIVDWHDHNAEDHLESAKTFFNNISSDYGNYPNLIYEIYNEPLDVSWSDVIKPYAVEVIEAIRTNDPDNLIIVGTGNWSQDVEDVITARIDDQNVVYALHFYTGTHRQWLRDKAISAISAGVPLFVSEWGLSEASGDGDIDINETNLWADFMEVNNLSWCNWSVTNKDETSAILLPSNSKLSGWEESELTESGKIIRDYLIRMNADLFKQLEQ